MTRKGRVIQSTGKWYKVDTGEEITNCRLPGKFRLNQQEVTNPVTVGDFVDIKILDDSSGVIQIIHPRKNWVPRQATHGRRGEQILIANVDRAWTVQSVRQPSLKPGFVDRFLVICEAYDVPPGIIINKTDLARKKDNAMLQDLGKLYTDLGYSFITTSIFDPESLNRLISELENSVSVFIGPSGTGKSSLLNAIHPNLNLSVGEISNYSDKGKHTTTYAQLIPIGNQGYIADTPGIRELGLVNIDPSELSLYYPEMSEPRTHCKFYNCTHSHEPDCGVVNAYEMGKIHPERYYSYLNILESL